MLKYKGYECDYQYDEEDLIWHGKIEGIRDLVNFESETYDGLEEEFHKAVDDYLKFCEEMGKEPDKPKCCGTCAWYAEFEGVCTNGDSEYRADFRYLDDTCDCWTSRGKIHAKRRFKELDTGYAERQNPIPGGTSRTTKQGY